ncbi:MAG TPA: hypothetical protein VI854_01125 [Acidimicrobiia bacterium]|nr:hypothetical protein [Acidimicrobiia bacterium]
MLLADSLSPTIVPIVVLGTFVLVVSTVLVVLFAAPGGTLAGPSDVAVAYEHAWDRLDFATLWNLSSPALRDGRSRREFVQDKQAAYRSEESLARLVRSVHPEHVEVNGPLARVLTRLELTDGQSVVDEMILERQGSAWQVAAYHIASRHSDGAGV